MRNDMDGSAPLITQQRSIPKPIHALSTLIHPHYVDFTAMTYADDDRSAEQWARDAFEEAFRSRAGRFVLGGLLRFRLARTPSPNHVGGLRIAERGDTGTWLRLEAASWLLTTHLVIQADGQQVSMATLTRYHHRIARPLWQTLSGKHRREAQLLLREAHKRKSAQA
ncbi:hypothetical protein [Streptomyces apocyni]|uniref:hypothetical protein n=1 Tax=Streptomyces apocyni TaxID=2654677 RepID=UPI001E6428F8|nr:hypothetical protein [Streptomyces apocyni]